MKISSVTILILNIIMIFGCKPENGKYQVVQFTEQIKAPDEIYIRYLSAQIEQYPDEEDNYIKLANIYSSHNNPTKATSLLQRAENEMPNNINILIHLSELYLGEEDIDNLSKTLRTIRKIDPDNMDFLKLSAGYSLLLKDYTNAIFFANRAMLVNPYDDENMFLRGSAQLINKDSLNAIISFEEAYRLKSSFKNFSETFDVLLAVKEISKAKKYLDEFTSNNPDQELCYEWGAYFSEIGKRDTSKSILMKCLHDRQDESRVNLELAKIYFRSDNVDSTLFYINHYLGSNPKGTEAHVLKAKALEKINFYTDAKKMYASALEIDSTSTLALRGLENLERKVAYLRLVKRKEEVQRQAETLKPLNSKVIN